MSNIISILDQRAAIASGGLEQIWMQKSKEEGEKQLCYWCERARETKLKPFIKVANTLMAKRTGILAWYEAHVTNATLEGINNKIKVMKRKAYGFRDDEYFKLLLLGLKDSTNAIRGWTINFSFYFLWNSLGISRKNTISANVTGSTELVVT